MDIPDSLLRLKTQEERIALRQHLQSEWNLYCVSRWVQAGSCSLVYRAGYEGRSVILKIPLDDEEATSGVRAALVQRFHGGVPIYRYHEASGATLMAELGVSLAESGLSDQECVRATADLIRWLHKAPVVEAQPLETWFKDLLEPSSAGNETLAIARFVARRLLETTSKRVLLHGDLHHFNILNSGEDWLAIDPKGVIGDPAFEPSAFLRNPVPAIAGWDNLKELMQVRIELFAQELGLSASRIWGWGFAQTALSGVWDDSDLKEPWIKLANVLESLAPIYEPGLA